MFPGVSTVGAYPPVGPSPNLHAEPGPVPTLSPKLAKGVVKPHLGFRSSFSQRRTSAAASLAPSLPYRLAISHHGTILSPPYFDSRWLFFFQYHSCLTFSTTKFVAAAWWAVLLLRRQSLGFGCEHVECRVWEGHIVRLVEGKLERGIDWCIWDVVERFGQFLNCEGSGRRVTPY